LTAWEPPLAYTTAASGYLVEQALYCEYRPLHIARSEKKPRPGPARLLTGAILSATGRTGWTRVVLRGEVLGVPVAVSPDAVLVGDDGVRAIVKSRIRRGLKLLEADWAQLYLAGLLVEGQGGGEPLLVQAVAEDKARLHHTLTTLFRAGPKPLMGEGWKVVTRVYDRERALQAVARPLYRAGSSPGPPARRHAPGAPTGRTVPGRARPSP